MFREAATLSLALLACASLTTLAWGVTPTSRELDRARRWSAEHLKRAASAPAAAAIAPPPAGLVVIANHGPILLNGRPDGRLLKIADTEYPHGLLCHAVSEVLVRLPGPGARFESTVGLDTHAGGGSIIFSVRVGDREAFRSPVMHCGEPGIPVSVDLAGATEFTLDVGDAGDWIACDHADWAEARVTLADGARIRLSDLPVLTPRPAARPAACPPFSFVYDGRPSDQLLPAWDYAERSERLDAARTRRTQTYTDPATGLQVRCVSVRYADFPVVEWTVYARNTGQADTPILEQLQGLDTRLGPAGREFVLHHNVGSPCQPNDFEPLQTPLEPDALQRISAAGGRPTNSDLCYFNLAWGDQGAIIGLGWPGQWAADFLRDGAGPVRIVAGQELTHLRLHPGEEVRTPLVALLLWSGGDVHRAQNLWRQWTVAHNLPRPGGELVTTHYGACFGNLQPNAAEELAVIEGYAREGIKLDYYFLDAGWYPDNGGWWNTGTWEPDPERFPRGVREVSDAAHRHGAKFVLWFEPERVAAGSWLALNHPEWILGGASGGLMNYGNPEAWAWVLERMDSLITSQGIDVYRQDFNIDPLGYWRGNDTEDRQGITENQHVTGYLALWDELLRRHPDLYIDTCASGGRRNDLETLRRSVPLLRSDYFGETTSQQAQTMGLAPWMPYYGSGMGTSDVYWFRSCIFPASRIGWDTRDPSLDYPLLKRMIQECYRVQEFQMGDFYPLTPYSLDNATWAAWQWHRDDRAAGVIQAFRREGCASASVTLKLRGLDPDARYTLRDADRPRPRQVLGRELMDTGLLVRASRCPAATVIYYEKAP